MRTSKVAQETSRLAGALASTPRRSRRVQTTAQDHGVFPPSAPTASGSRKRKRTSPQTSCPSSSASLKLEADDASEIAKEPRARRGRRMPAKRVKEEDGSYHIEPPVNWQEMYSLTQEMRRGVIAPVDHQGCESLADVTDSPVNQRYQTLTALMLSSQTKDPVTAAAIHNLQQNLPGGLNLQSVLDVEPDRLNELIGKVGFHNLKTKYIKRTAEILRDEWAGDIPDTIEGMVSLPGVGPKMAYLTMSAAWGRDEGIGVDVHVHRITNLWGWHKTNQPEETRAMLEAWLPRDKWHEINHLLVGFGQTICLPVGRKCGHCTLADKGLCPGAVVAKLNKKGTVIKIESIPEVELNGSTDNRSTKYEVDQAHNEVSIKAEDINGSAEIADIEDVVAAVGTKVEGRNAIR